MNTEILKARILELCEEKAISISHLEEKIGISQGAISRWSKSTPNIDKIYRAAGILGVSTDYLLGISNIRETAENTLKDHDIISIQRARNKMNSNTRKKMMDILTISFEEFEKDDNYGNDGNDDKTNNSNN